MVSKPLTPSATRELLASIDHRPRKNLGQNFLIDGNIVRKSLELAGISETSRVVEVGPGLGTLTRSLLEAGATVFAVELDPKLATYLQENWVEPAEGRLQLMQADAVAFPVAGLPDSPDEFKVVANLPYAITTPWLAAVLERSHLPRSLTLMLQKEAADRLIAPHGSKSFSAITIQLSAAYKKVARHPVARQCFYPVPGVDSVLLHLEKLEMPHRLGPESLSIIRNLFTRRRKQVGQCVRDFPQLAAWLDQLHEFGGSRQSRPDEIPVEAWLKLDAQIQNFHT